MCIVQLCTVALWTVQDCGLWSTVQNVYVDDTTINKDNWRIQKWQEVKRVCIMSLAHLRTFWYIS